MKLQLILIFFFCISTANNVYAYTSNLPSDEYYQHNLADNTPADNYYQKNLRWDDPDDPGGEGDGGDTPVGGVPLGEISLSGIILMALMGIVYKKKRMNRIEKYR